MPAERKKSVNMEEKETGSFSNKDRDADRQAAAPKSKDETKMSAKKDGAKTAEDKKRRAEEDKRKKEERERKKKEEEKQRAEEEQKKKEEEEKRQQEEQEKKLLEEEARRQKEEEAAQLKEKEEAEQLQQEAWERHHGRKELRVKNQHVQETRPEEAFFSRLDSSLKKNTAFVKKLRTLTEQQRGSLSQDFDSLNLSKYIGEAVSSMVEAKLKISDVGCAVHLCSLFHQRYADFAPLLLAAWKRHFEARKEEKSPNVSKLRTDLRFIAELTIVGLFTDKEGLSLIYEQLKNIIGTDRDTHTHVSVIISFCKHCGDDIAGLVPRKVKNAVEKFGSSFPPSQIINAEKQQPFQNLLREYFTSLTKHLKKDHRELQNIERQNRRILHSKGELSEDRHKQYEEFATSYQKLLANTQTLADLLDENMPELPVDKTVQEEHGPGIDIFTPGKPGEYDLEGGIWEDEDARNFYENMVDLKAFVPAILFKDNEKSSQPSKEAREGSSTEELEMELEALDIADEPIDLDTADETESEELAKKLLDEQEQEDEEASTGSHLKLIVDAFIQQLPNCINRDLIDKKTTNKNDEQMMRKKQAQHLDGRYVTMVENAYYYCNPPPMEKTVRRKRPPLQEYIRKLLYKDLSKVTTEKVRHACTGRRVPNPQTSYAQMAMNIICALLIGLIYYQMPLSLPEPKFNQRRISSAKFLGELYNYRMVESAVIFRTLFSFISFGVNADGSPSPLDPPEHLFRIRLVCTLLDTCGQYFDRGSSKKKLDCFLIYFQRYVWWKKSLDVWTKDQPFPIDIEYMITDTLELLRPKMKLCSSLDEACAQVTQLEREFLIKLGLEKDGRSSSAMSENEPLDEEDDDDEDERGAETEEQSGNESEMNEPEEEEGSDNEEEEREEEEENTDYLTDSNKENETDEENNEVTIRGGGLKHVACAEDEDFIQALDKMMLENLQQRSGEAVKVHQLDVAIPLQLKSQLKKSSAPSCTADADAEADISDTMQFVMLTRKGNKQQFKILNVPLSSHLAANHFNQQQAEQEERMRMKKLTLDINERQEQEDYQEMMQSLAQRPAPANTNRERRPRYQHPKGAPNADLIFKTGGRRTRYG
uniref:UPF2 regulator of nonsense mediated mRNA decay n=1 Tax=Cyprinus carpio TaxID=7962 RepID=A0A8C2IV80_CYPCA